MEIRSEWANEQPPMRESSYAHQGTRAIITRGGSKGAASLNFPSRFFADGAAAE
jgi:hypothetical protein